MPDERAMDREAMPGATPVEAIVRDVVTEPWAIIEGSLIVAKVRSAGRRHRDCRRADDRNRGQRDD
jgi:hypothetical protein